MRVSINNEQLKEAFEHVRDDACFEESCALLDSGSLPTEMIRALALRPEILRAFGATAECVYPGGVLDRQLKEYVIVEASRANACQFCCDSHVAVMKLLNMTSDPLADVQEPEKLSDRHRLAVLYTRAATKDATRVSNELFAELGEHFSDVEIVELTFLIGYINMLNLFNNALQVTYLGEYDNLDAHPAGDDE